MRHACLIKACLCLAIFSLCTAAVAAYPVTIQVQSNMPFSQSVYRCGNGQCSSLSYFTQDSGNPNQYTIPTQPPGTHYFAEFDYKACYVPFIFRTDVNGNTCNNCNLYDIDFVKEPDCWAPVLSLDVPKTTYEAGETVKVDATIRSVWLKPPELPNVQIPAALRDDYSNHIDVFLSLDGSFIDSTAVDIVWSETDDVTFTFPAPGEAGTYEVGVYTKVDNDCECSGSSYRSLTTTIRVLECETDNDCSDLDDVFCQDDTLVEHEGVCRENVCIVETDETECDDGLFCNGDEACMSGACVAGEDPCEDGIECTVDSCNEETDSCTFSPDDTVCDDGLFCNGDEICVPSLGCQAGCPVDCSGNDIPPIATCDYTPDGITFTWDSFPGFDSVCDEGADRCTNGNISLNHTCDTARCGAECEEDTDCPDTNCQDKCVGNDYYEYDDVINTCLGDCSCTNNSCGAATISYDDPRCTECQTDDDCDDLDMDYCNGTAVVEEEGVCIDFACQVNTTVTECDNSLFCDGSETCFNASCIAGAPPDCSDSIACTDDLCNETSDSCDHVPDDTVCDDGLFCNGDEICVPSLGCQAGCPVDCSGNDIPPIATCDYTPDGITFTWDSFPGFDSVCDEGADRCTNGNISLNHTCDTARCGAECEEDTDCPDTNCQDKCVGNDYYEYDDVINTCLGDCSCTNNSCGAATISYDDPRCTDQKDAKVSSAMPRSNFGDGRYMMVNPKVGGTDRSFIRTNEYGTLHIAVYYTGNNSVGDTIEAYSCTEDFIEDNITWMTQPTDCTKIDEYVITQRVISGIPETWHTFDVPAGTIMLKSDSEGAVFDNSHYVEYLTSEYNETAYRPRIT